MTACTDRPIFRHSPTGIIPVSPAFISFPALFYHISILSLLEKIKNIFLLYKKMLL